MIYLANVTTLAYSPDKCTGCGRCAEVCPRGVFVMKEDNGTLTPAPLPQGEGKMKGGVRRAMVTDKDLCLECGACALNCEFGAIAVSSGVGCAAALINGMITGGAPTCGCDSTPGSVCC
jgi:NAD-dependent dihydropyrimidine dehydrogenase PreA subunit